MKRALDWFYAHETAVRRGVVATATAAALLPLILARYLPFCDLYGAMGVVAAYLHKGDPAVDAFYTFRASPTPTALYFAVATLFGKIMPLWAATNLFIGLFVIALPIAALAYGLRVFEKDPWLILLAFPALYHRTLWFGFVSSCATIGLTLLVIPLAYEIARGRRDPLRLCGLAIASLLLAAAHSFQGLVALSLTLVMIALCRGARARDRLTAAALLLPGWIYIIRWLGGMLGGGGKGGSALTTLGRAIGGTLFHKGPRPSLAELHEWFIEGVKVTHLDDTLAIVAGLSLIAFVVFGVRARGEDKTGRTPLALWAVLGGVVLCYVLLPKTVYVPIYWWAVRVRFIVPSFLIAILCVRSARRGLPRVFLLPAFSLALVWFVWLARDLRTHFNQTELGGFDAALDAIPRGQRLMVLFPLFETEKHYVHYPHAFLGTHYVARSGGIAYPLMHGTHRELWTVYNFFEAPSWGQAHLFNWKTYASRWDYILVKDNLEKPTRALTDAPPGALRAVGQFGLWRLYQNLTASPNPATSK